ncbi:hypothetical protein SOVF_205190 isoform A [Spinacia oleracea]|nr:hypothetical protein SOVF_205190 isoform A [Spinacia oleracea]
MAAAHPFILPFLSYSLSSSSALSFCSWVEIESSSWLIKAVSTTISARSLLARTDFSLLGADLRS